MRMRPLLVAAVCSAGAALVLILGELALLGPTHHTGGTANNSAPVTKSPTQVSGGESVGRAYRFDETGTSSDTPTDDQSTGDTSSNGADSQSTLPGVVQQVFSNAAVPIKVGPIGR
jgi:hypothetical protein